MENVVIKVIWEHEWDQMKNTEVYNDPQYLEPCNALFGGRTYTAHLWYSACDDEQILYVDVTSLYPYVNANFTYATGHPKIILRDFKNPLLSHQSCCDSSPGLYLPVLPYRSPQGKLVFTLCCTCTDTNNSNASCTHSNEERALSCTWTTPEFMKTAVISWLK